MAGPSSASRHTSSLTLTLWRVTGGAASTSSSAPGDKSGSGGGVGGVRSRTRGGSGAAAGAAAPEAAAALPRLTELHFVALEGGSLTVPAPRAGLDRAPPGTVPALLPLFFPGLRAVAPPVQVGSGGRTTCSGLVWCRHFPRVVVVVCVYFRALLGIAPL